MAIVAMKVLIEVVIPNLDGEEDMCATIDDLIDYADCSGEIIRKELLPYVDTDMDQLIDCTPESMHQAIAEGEGIS